MVNLVTIDDTRYLVDVAFGSNSPIRPIPLESGIEFDGVASSKGKLEYRALAQHSDPNQRVWIYSTQEDSTAPWKEQYCFVETEFFPADFEVMNFSTMTSPQSFFVKTVVASRILLDNEHRPIGKVTLNQDYIRIRNDGIEEIMVKLETEEDRVAALQNYFSISLSTQETDAIKGLSSELKHQAPGADF
jgi:arylamine N-acetyltransferase